MKLTVFNGSPRLEKSSTKQIITPFCEGFCKNNANSIEMVNIYNNNMNNLVEIFIRSEIALVCMPLFTDAMPSGVKRFIEAVSDRKDNLNKKKIVFFVQTGLSEAEHSKGLEKYLIKWCKKMSMEMKGIILKPHGNRIDEQPPWDRNSLYKKMRKLGTYFGKKETLDPKILKEISGVERYKGIGILIVKTILYLFGYRYFDAILKRNCVYEKRYEKPYLDQGLFKYEQK